MKVVPRIGEEATEICGRAVKSLVNADETVAFEEWWMVDMSWKSQAM